MSQKFSLNKRQIVKGLIFTIFAAILPILIATFNTPDFDVRNIFNWDLLNNLIKTGSMAFLYFIYSYFEGNKNTESIKEKSENSENNETIPK